MDLSAIQSVAAIIGAIITATVASLVTYFIVVKRKGVTFWIVPSSDLALPLLKHRDRVGLTVDGKEATNLNSGSVVVKNTGNASITNFTFDVEIAGAHPLCFAEVTAGEPKLRKAVEIKVQPVAAITARPGTAEEYAAYVRENSSVSINVAVPFFNPKESFELMIYFDKATKDCTVSFRMEDVGCKIRTAGEWEGWLLGLSDNMLVLTMPRTTAAMKWILEQMGRSMPR